MESKSTCVLEAEVEQLEQKEQQEQEPKKTTIIGFFPFGATGGSVFPINPEDGSVFGEEVVKKLLEEGANIFYAASEPYGKCQNPVPGVIVYDNHPEVPKETFDNEAAKGSMNYFGGRQGLELYKRLVTADLRVVLETILNVYEQNQLVDNIVLVGMYRPSLPTAADILKKLLDHEINVDNLKNFLKILNENGLDGIKNLLSELEKRQGIQLTSNKPKVTVLGIVDSPFTPDKENKFQVTTIPDTHPLRIVRDLLPPMLRDHLNKLVGSIQKYLSNWWAVNINELRASFKLPPVSGLFHCLWGNIAIVTDHAEIAGVTEDEKDIKIEPTTVHKFFQALFGYRYPGHTQKITYVGPLVGKLSDELSPEEVQKVNEFLDKYKHVVVLNMGSTGTEVNIEFTLDLLSKLLKEQNNDHNDIGIIVLGAGHKADKLGLPDLLEKFNLSNRLLYFTNFNPLKLYESIANSSNVEKVTIFIHGGRGTFYDLIAKLKNLATKDIAIFGIPTQVEQEINVKRLAGILNGENNKVVHYIDPYYTVKLYDLLKLFNLKNLVTKRLAQVLLETFFRKDGENEVFLPSTINNLDLNGGYRGLLRVILSSVTQ